MPSTCAFPGVAIVNADDATPADHEALARLVDDVLKAAVRYQEHDTPAERETLDRKLVALAEAVGAPAPPPVRGQWSRAERENVVTAIADRLSNPAATRALQAVFGLW